MIQLIMKISLTNNAIQMLYVILVATIRNYSRYHVSVFALVFSVIFDKMSFYVLIMRHNFLILF